MQFSLSTSWNASRCKKARDLVFEIKDLGFNQIELGFSLNVDQVKEIAELVKHAEIKVSSTHNFCPMPLGLPPELALPDCFSMSSKNEEERQKSVQFAKKTIETANLLQAKAVVLHTGRVEIPDKTRKLMNLCAKGLSETKEFISLRDEIRKERKEVNQPFLDNTLRSLEELNKTALENNILLGVETRFYYREIPVFEEIGIILDEFKGSNIFYWHDTGHAEVMEKLGFYKHKDFLSSYGQSLLGVHLHDVICCSDHMAPSTGKLDFSIIKPYLKEDTIKVIEAHFPATGEEIKASVVYLNKIFNG